MPELQPTRGLTPRAFTTGLVLVLAWVLYDCTLAVSPALYSIEVLYLFGFGAVFTLFVVQVVNGRMPEHRRLSVQELTVIYAMVAVAIPWGILIRGALEAPIKLLVVNTSKHDPSVNWLRDTDVWVTKSRDALEMFRRGGVKPWEIPWTEWGIPILYWSAILLSFQVFAISVVLFFRRLFIDEEKLPFPLATVGQSIVEYRPSRSEEASARKLRTAVRVAFFVGLLICLPGILSITPDAYTPIPMNSGYFGTQTGIIEGLSVNLSWDPFVLCFLMFFPLDVLFTVTVFYVGLNIVVPMVCLWSGIPKPDVGSITLNVFGMGGLVGLAFWTVFFNRSSIAKGIRRALEGERSPEAGEPFGYRAILLTMVISFLVFMALFIRGLGDMAGDARHVISLAVVVVMLLVMVLSIMRLSGEQGWHYHSPWTSGKIIAYMHHHYMRHPTVLFRTQASFLTISHVVHFVAFHSAFAPHLHVLDSLKVASQTQTSTRDVMKAVALTLVIALVVTIPGYLMLIHYYGFEHGETSSDWWNFWNYEEPQHGMAYNAIPSIFNRFNPGVSILIGWIIIGVVMYFRRERVRFPLSPVGVVMAAGLSYFNNYTTYVIWLPIIIVLVVKRIIYRWFGVGFFRQKVVPVLLFLMMGLMTGMFIYKLIFAAMGKGFLRPY
ncbi:MAG TPA: DUF6785 family protein [Planctomycetota bacterium]|nr:DUF6785 family protein [Planctomycetota bacterium]